MGKSFALLILFLAFSVGSVVADEGTGGPEDPPPWAFLECGGDASDWQSVPENDKIDNLPGSNDYPGSDLSAAIDAATFDFSQILATAARMKCEDCPRFSLPCRRDIQFSTDSEGNLLIDPDPVTDGSGAVTGYNIYLSFFGDYRVQCVECANSTPE